MIDRPRGRPRESGASDDPRPSPDEIRIPLVGVRQTRDVPVTLDEPAVLALNLERVHGGLRPRWSDNPLYATTLLTSPGAVPHGRSVWAMVDTSIGPYLLTQFWVARCYPTPLTVDMIRSRSDFLYWAQVENETVFLIQPNAWVAVHALGFTQNYLSGPPTKLVVRSVAPWREEYATTGFIQIGRDVLRYERARETADGFIELEGLTIEFSDQISSLSMLSSFQNAPVWWVCDLSALPAPQLVSAGYAPSGNVSDYTTAILAPMVMRKRNHEDYENPPETAYTGRMTTNIGKWNIWDVVGDNHSVPTRHVRGGLVWSGLNNYQAAIPIVPKDRSDPDPLGEDTLLKTAADPKNAADETKTPFYLPYWYFESDFSASDYGALKVDFLHSWNQHDVHVHNPSTGKVSTHSNTNYWWGIGLVNQDAHGVSSVQRVSGLASTWVYWPPRYRLVAHPPIRQPGDWWMGGPFYFGRGIGLFQNSYAHYHGLIPMTTPSSDLYESERTLWGFKSETDSSIPENCGTTVTQPAYGFKTTLTQRGGRNLLNFSTSGFYPMGSRMFNWYLRFIAPTCAHGETPPESALQGAWAYTRSAADQNVQTVRFNEPPIDGLDRFYPRADTDPSYNPAPLTLPNRTWNQVKTFFDQIKPLWDTMLVVHDGRLYYNWDISHTVLVDPAGIECTLPRLAIYNIGTSDLKSGLSIYAVRAKTVDGKHYVPAHWTEDDLIPMEIVGIESIKVAERKFNGGWQGASVVRSMLYVEAENLTLRIPQQYAGERIAGLLIRYPVLGWGMNAEQPSWTTIPAWHRHIPHLAMITDPMSIEFYWGQPICVLTLAQAQPSMFKGYESLPNTNQNRWARPLRRMYQWCAQIDFRPIPSEFQLEQIWACVRRGVVYSFASKPVTIMDRDGSALRVVVRLDSLPRPTDVLTILSSYASEEPMLIYEAPIGQLTSGADPNVEYEIVNGRHEFRIVLNDPKPKRVVSVSEAELPYGAAMTHMNRYLVYDGSSVWISRFGQPVFHVYQKKDTAGFMIPAPESKLYLSRADGKPYLIGESASYLIIAESPTQSGLVPVRSVYNPAEPPVRCRVIADDCALEWDRVSEQGRPILWVLPFDEFANSTNLPGVLSIGLFRFGQTPYLFMERSDRYELYVFRDSADGWLLWEKEKHVADQHPRVVSLTIENERIVIASPIGLGLSPGNTDSCVLIWSSGDELHPKARYRSGAVRLHRGLRIRKAAVIGNTLVESDPNPIKFRHFTDHDVPTHHREYAPRLNRTFAVRTVDHKHYALYFELEWVDPRAPIVRVELIPARAFNW